MKLHRSSLSHRLPEFLISVLLCAFSPVHAETLIGGTCSRDTTFTLANSPYTLSAALNVYNCTVTFERGVQVNLNGHSIVIGYSAKPGSISAEGVTFVNSTTSDQYVSFNAGSGGTLRDCVLDNVYVYIVTGLPRITSCKFKNITNPFRFNDLHAHPILSGNTYSGLADPRILLSFSKSVTESDTLTKYEIPYKLSSGMTLSGCTFFMEPDVKLDLGSYSFSVGTSGKPATLNADSAIFESSSSSDRYILFDYGSGGTLANCTLDNVYVAVGDAAPAVTGCMVKNVNCPVTLRDLNANPSLSGLRFEQVTNERIGLESGFVVNADFTLKKLPLDYLLLASKTVAGCTLTVTPGTLIDLNGKSITFGQSSSPATLIATGAFFVNSATSDQYLKFNYGSGGTITGCTFDNVYLSVVNGSPSISLSNFLNTAKGVSNTGTQVVSAENNYWGDPSGPTHASNPGGKGVGVSDNVDFDPWLAAFSLYGVTPPAPSVVLDPPSLDLSTGEERTLTFRLRNTGGAADRAYLGVSFSGNIRVTGASPSDRWTRYEKGGAIPLKGGGTAVADYLAYEFHDPAFGSGEKTVTLTLKRMGSGPAWMRYRLAMNPDGSAPYGWYTYRAYPETGEPDQQGWSALKLDILEPLGVSIASIGQRNFFVYMNAAVDTFGVGFPGIGPADFAVYEDGKLQTDRFTVTPPAEGGGVRLADIVFIMDNSGSMLNERNAIRANVQAFVNQLAASGADFALGLCRYGASNAAVVVEDGGVLTADATYFTTTLWNRNVTSGSVESGYYAIKTAANGFAFRPGSQRIFIILTDETPDQGKATLADALAACRDNSITLFALTQLNLFPLFTPITSETNGDCFDVVTPFDTILGTISTHIASTYLITYASSNPHVWGETRTVELRVTRGGSTAVTTGSYIPGSEPEITRTPATIALHRAPTIEHSPLVIEAFITDRFAPFISGATLFYRRTGESAFATVAMTASGDSLWSATIPSTAVASPGVDYYLSATDGGDTVTDPMTDAMGKPYQIAVLPNVAPRIVHVPVSAHETGTAVGISATVTDSTNAVSRVTLSYRKTGQIVYQTVDMTNTAGNTYTAEIPVSYVTRDGVDYYIRALDDFNLGAYEGRPDDPLRIVTGSYGVLAASLTRVVNGPPNDRVEVPANGSGYLYWSLIAGSDSVEYDGDIPMLAARDGSAPVTLTGKTVAKGLYRVTVPAYALGADSTVVFTLPGSIAAGSALYQISSGPVSFTAVKRAIEYERAWDLFAGGSAGVSGSVGSVGAGPSVAAAKLSVKGEGGMGLTFTRDSEGNFSIGRRLEVGVGVGAEVPSINLGVDEVGITGITAQLMNKGLLGQSFTFTDIGLSEDMRKMAQTGLVLETLSLGGIALSPVVGIVLSSVVTTINELSNVSAVFDDAKRELYWGLGVEGSVGAGVSMNVGDFLKLTFAQATAGFALHGKYTDRYGPPGTPKYAALGSGDGSDVFRLKPAKYAAASFLGKTREVRQAATFNFSVLSVNPKVGDGVELGSGNLSLFDGGVGAEVAYAADYDDLNAFDGLTVSLKGGGNAAIFGAGRSIYYNTDIRFPREYAAVLRNSSTGVSGMAGGSNTIRLGPTAMAEDAITAMNEALSSSVGVPLRVTSTECLGQGFNLSIGLDLEAALGVGLGVQVGITGKYFDEIQYPRKITDVYPGNVNYLLASADYTSAMESGSLQNIMEDLLEGVIPLVRTALLNAINIFDDLVEAGEQLVVDAVNDAQEVVGEVAGTFEDAGTVVVSTFETGLSMLNPFDKPAGPRTVRRMYWSPRVLHRIAGVGKAALEPAGRGTILVVVSDAMHVEFIPKGSPVAADSLPSPVDMKMVVYGRALERNGFRPEDRDLVRLYSYDGKTQYWVREDGVRRADTLSVRTTRTGTYALGIEVNLNNDVTPPDIFESGPRGKVGTASPEVFATIRDDLNGTGIDLSRSRIVVDADTLTTTFDPVNLRLFGVPAKPLGSGTHAVTVIAADNSGNIGTETFAFIVDLGEGVGEEPLEFAVSAPYPNPFNPSTTIRYTLPKDCAVEFVVYDIRGARVAVLASGFRKAGRHDAVWNGRTLSGAEAASGVYLYRVKAGGRTAQGKVVLVR